MVVDAVALAVRRFAGREVESDRGSGHRTALP